MHPETSLVPSLVVFVAAVWAFAKDLVSVYIAIPVLLTVGFAVLNWRVRRQQDEWR